MSAKPALDQLYGLVANEEGARLQGYTRQRLSRGTAELLPDPGQSILTKLGDLLISPKTVLAWLLGTIGAPAAMIAWLVPIRESGSMIPQLAIGAWVRRHPTRKLFWVAGSLAMRLPEVE